MNKVTVRIHLTEAQSKRVIMLDNRTYNMVLNAIGTNNIEADPYTWITASHVDVVENIADEFNRYLKYARTHHLRLLASREPNGFVHSFVLLNPITNIVRSDKIVTPVDYPKISQDIFGPGICIRYFNNDDTNVCMRAVKPEMMDGPCSWFTRFELKLTSNVTVLSYSSGALQFGAVYHSSDDWYLKFKISTERCDMSMPNTRCITEQVQEYLKDTSAEWYDPTLKFYLEMQYPG